MRVEMLALPPEPVELCARDLELESKPGKVDEVAEEIDRVRGAATTRSARAPNTALLVMLPSFIAAEKPQGTVSRLQRLVDNAKEVSGECLQVDLLSELGREVVDGPLCVELRAVEAPVDK